jgi:selenocysteine lyase/cysteine desulfurase
MISCKRSKFSLPSNLTYLNCAYMSPLLKSVEKAGIRGLRKKRNPGSISPQDFFTESDLLREEFAKLINAPKPNRIVIIPSVSYGLATVARNLNIGPGKKIIVAADQFPSNYYPWLRLAAEHKAEVVTVAPPPEFDQRGKIWNERILEAIDSRTKAVALGNIHWADGTLFSLEEIRKRTHDVGALLIIDGTQSIGALPFDVSRIQPDALICAGYKWLLGPYSIGMAYYSEYFDSGQPIEENWINRLNSEDFAQLVNYQPSYQEGSLRYEVGEHSNFALVPMLLNSIRQVNRWGVENIQSYCKTIGEEAVTLLQQGGYWIEDAAFRSSHLFGIRIGDRDPQTIKRVLSKNKIYVSFRGDAIRVSPNVYNNKSDMDKLSKILLS